MGAVRPAAVAGMFYPAEARELDATVQRHLSQAIASMASGASVASVASGASGAPETTTPADEVPKAIIAPHAGFIYSGPIAASAYARLKPAHDRITRVVLLGPCHRVAVRGLALSGADAFATPLGEVAIDRQAADGLLDLPQVQVFDATHGEEHSLEVHLPFLQVVLDRFSIVPLVVGDASPDEVAKVIERLWGGPETLIVVSSDLSHYLDYETAQRLDDKTCKSIECLDPAAIGREQACGRVPISGLLTLAKRRGLRVATLDVRNSGDTAGDRDKVVGYGSWMFLEDPDPAAGEEDDQSDDADADAFAAETKGLLQRHGATLLRIAAAAIEHGAARGVEHGNPLRIDLAKQPAELTAPGACFVTLHQAGRLRGCIGSATAQRPLIVDAAENGFAAAFKDPRFPPVTTQDISTLELSISVLSASVPMAFDDETDFLSRLRPGIDGLIIEDQGHRALFLPSVWEALPTTEAFVSRLKMKAGLAANHWSETFKAWHFIAEEASALSLDDPASLWRAASAE